MNVHESANTFLEVVVRYLGLDAESPDAAAQRAAEEGHPDLDAAVDQLAADLGEVASPEEINAVRVVTDRYRREIEESSALFGLNASLYRGREINSVNSIVGPLTAAFTDWPGRKELAGTEAKLSALRAKRSEVAAKVEAAIQALDVPGATKLQAQLDGRISDDMTELELRRLDLHRARATAYAMAPRLRAQENAKARTKSEQDVKAADAALKAAFAERELHRVRATEIAMQRQNAEAAIEQAEKEYAAALAAAEQSKVTKVRQQVRGAA